MYIAYLDVQSCDGNLMELEDLLTELAEVTDWFSFGVNLEIHEPRLKEIEKKWESVESCKREMLIVWMQQAHPSWKAVVIALAGIDMKDLAIKISNKYGEYAAFTFPIASLGKFNFHKLILNQAYVNYTISCFMNSRRIIILLWSTLFTM